MIWDKIPTFIASVESGSFSKAAVKLGINQSSVSRQISDLEYLLRTPLFHRNHRGLVLTSAGEKFYKLVKEASEIVSEAEYSIKEEYEGVSGKILVQIHPDSNIYPIRESLSRFSVANNVVLEIEVTMEFSPEAVVVSPILPDSLNLIQRMVSRCRYGVFQSVDGEPEISIIYGTGRANRAERRENKVLDATLLEKTRTIEVDSTSSAVDLLECCRKSGICAVSVVPEIVSSELHRREDLESDKSEEYCVYVACSERFKNFRKIKALKEHLSSFLSRYRG